MITTDSKSVSDYLNEVPDEVLSAIKFSVPWHTGGHNMGQYDADGAPILSPNTSKDYDFSGMSRKELQTTCWDMFNRNPQLNTAVRGVVGRLTGLGFDVSSGIYDIQEVLEDVTNDQRNRLYDYWPKYIGRSLVEGELFLPVTLHDDGFTEVDFYDPALIDQGGDNNTGIIFHPSKTKMPLFYNINNSAGDYDQVPSIYIARYPELIKIAKEHPGYNRKYQKSSITSNPKFKKLGGYNRFVISWDKSFITQRATSYMRTTLLWINHYENLKKYEIDHKKSSGSYLWVYTIENPRDYKLWLSLSDSEKAKTGISTSKGPGDSVVLPPGMKVQCLNPNLTSISDQDTDIMAMITSGLNEEAGVTNGSGANNFSAAKASQGPMSDRISDEIAYFKRFLTHDFWGNIFYLRSAVSSFPDKFKVKKAVGWKNKKPVMKNIWVNPESEIEISFPVSETIDIEGRARATLGVKHGPLAETVGISNNKVADIIGISGYAKQRLDKATEDELYPELDYNVDAEALQEKTEGEKPDAAVIKKVKENKNEKSE